MNGTMLEPLSNAKRGGHSAQVPGMHKQEMGGARKFNKPGSKAGAFNRPMPPKSFKQEEREKKKLKEREYIQNMSKLSVKNQNNCSKCGHAVVTDHKGGRVVCTYCGVVKEDRFIDTASEYRYFIENTSLRNDPRRVGNSVNMHMDSQIDLIEIDDGKRNFHTFANQSNADKMFNRATKIIKRFCDTLDLRDNIIRQVEDMYYQILDQKELKGKKLEIIISACIYLVCKRNLVNLHPSSLEPLADKKEKKILKVAKIILRYIPPINVDSYDYVKIYGRELNLKPNEIEDMVENCKEIKQVDFFRSKQPAPRSVAASVIHYYLSNFSNDKRSLSAIKEVSGISTDATITNYYNDFNSQKSYLEKIIIKRKPDRGNTKKVKAK